MARARPRACASPGVEPGRGRALIRPSEAAVALARIRSDDDRASRRFAVRRQRINTRVAATGLQSDLFSGRRLFGALEQLDRMTRHDGRDGVLLERLRVAV